MGKSEFLLLLDDLMELEAGTLKGPEVLASLDGWDSLGVISFMALVDEQFGISVEPTKINECTTVAALIGLLNGSIQQEGNA